MVYSFDSASSGNAAAAVKKSFTADNGLKYQWDDVENDWVEFEGPDRSVANILSLTLHNFCLVAVVVVSLSKY